MPYRPVDLIVTKKFAGKPLKEILAATFGGFAPVRETRLTLRQSDHPDDVEIWSEMFKRIPKECRRGDPERGEWDLISTFGDPIRERVVRLVIMRGYVECVLDHYVDASDADAKLANSG